MAQLKLFKAFVLLLSTASMATPQIETRPPLAHVRFCYFYEGQCEIVVSNRQGSLEELRQVNLRVNRAIRPVEDLHGDLWELGVTEGDCEEYAIQKRADLLALGWASQHLRLAIVRIPDDRYHIVLIASIDGQEYLLDNLTNRIVTREQSTYTFLMVQSADNPRNWYRLSRG
jgi:predicted transglutaminase-like cysteine proteinase